ncbi:MAG: hypothetical protein CEE40_05895 [Chloroflexi bacterium B3_Chlor]|nr:MAG: hypothetical protein CEE40_05895 [Chloroflexi bacterium B3_Chlor]
MVWLQRMEEEAREIRMPEEWGGVVPSPVFLDEARRIVEEGEKQGLILRAMGGVGIRLDTLGHEELGQRLARLGEGEQEFTDLDFVSYKKHRKQMQSFFEGLGYLKRRATLSSAASERQIYFHENGWFFVDVFFDKLMVANHRLDFRDRLELNPLTLSPTDLLLEKLQIVRLSEKDFKDTLMLLFTHQLAEEDREDTINASYIATLLSKDWGFWYTLTTNLKGIMDLLPTAEALSDDERRIIKGRVDELLAHIDAQPKTMGWKARSKIGPKKRWYEPVETEDTVGDFGIWRMMTEKRED